MEAGDPPARLRHHMSLFLKPHLSKLSDELKEDKADVLVAEYQKDEEKLDKTLVKLLATPSARKELQFWITKSIGDWNLSSSQRVRASELFLSSDSLLKEVLLFACEKVASDVIPYFIDDDQFFRRFFRDHPERISGWFSHFHLDHSERGAYALEKYALSNRDDFWHLLQWKYSTVPSPIVIVHQRVRFLELDIQKTVQSLADRDDHFWRSTEFRDSLRSAAANLFAIEPSYFVDYLIRNFSKSKLSFISEKLFSDASRWKEICQRLFLVLEPSTLRTFLYHLFPSSNTSSLTTAQYILTQCNWKSSEEFLVFGALAVESRQILKMLSISFPSSSSSPSSLLGSKVEDVEDDSKAKGGHFFSVAKTSFPGKDDSSVLRHQSSAEASQSADHQLLETLLKKGSVFESDEESSKNRLRHFAIISALKKKNDVSKQILYCLRQSLRNRYALLKFFANREALEKIMKEEGIAFEVVEMERTDKEARKRLKKEKKRIEKLQKKKRKKEKEEGQNSKAIESEREQEEEEEDLTTPKMETVFVGWKLLRTNSASLPRSIQEIAGEALPDLALENTLSVFRS